MPIISQTKSFVNPFSKIFLEILLATNQNIDPIQAVALSGKVLLYSVQLIKAIVVISPYLNVLKGAVSNSNKLNRKFYATLRYMLQIVQKLSPRNSYNTVSP